VCYVPYVQSASLNRPLDAVRLSPPDSAHLLFRITRITHDRFEERMDYWEVIRENSKMDYVPRYILLCWTGQHYSGAFL